LHRLGYYRDDAVQHFEKRPFSASHILGTLFAGFKGSIHLI
jgi:hypothetical protein